jgi:uncharacterized protein YjbJ (UPF0337 family)
MSQGNITISIVKSAFALTCFPLIISKLKGQFHSVKGTLVETIGEVTGAKSWSEAGREEYAKGEAEIRAAQEKEKAK